MKKDEISMKKFTSRNATVALVAWCFLWVGFVFYPTAVQAQQIGFKVGASIANASINGIKGSKWDDASVVATGYPGMAGKYWDWDQNTTSGGHAYPAVPRNVRVFSKRDGNNLYIAFDVEDNTRERRTPGTNVSPGPLAVGERIVIQIDPDHGMGTSLFNDFRVEMTHKWSANGSSINLHDKVFSNSAGVIGLCPTVSFNPVATFPSTIVVAASITGTGYFAEFKIPFSEIGLPMNHANDIGVAFAVINDLGYKPSMGDDEATGVSFPTGLPINNMSNPFFPECDWIIPNNWGLGYFSNGLANVTINRNPVWWSSLAVNASACGVPNYVYYPVHPCKITVTAGLDNSSATQQTRNILFLWAEDGANPVVWRVIDLKENIIVPGDTGSGFEVVITSAEFADQAIKNKLNHPCVRVYILPSTFQADFDREAILAIDSQSDLDTMVSKYGLTDDHNAQKNITRHDTTPDCPIANCQIAGVTSHDGEVIVRNARGPAMTTTYERNFPARGYSEPKSLYAYPKAGLSGLIGENIGAEPVEVPTHLDAVSPQDRATVQVENRLISTAGRPIYLSPSEADRYVEDVIVQVRAFGYIKQPPNEKTQFNFIEALGGVIHLFPVELIREDKDKSIPFELNVGNPGKYERVILLLIDTYTPPSLSGIKIVSEIRNFGAETFRPDETRVARGTVNVGGGGSQPSNRFGLSLHAGTNVPHGNFGKVFDPGFSFTADLEYRVNNNFSLEGLFGYNRFRGGTLNAVCPPNVPGCIPNINVPDLNLYNVSVNGKFYYAGTNTRPFVNFGGGVYKFDQGDTRGGGNFGFGVQRNISSRLALEGAYNLHGVATPGSATWFSTVQFGIRMRP